ncbi:hypothetical protein [Jeotgalibaca ciconiae]|uniref:Uncharacterized protein n=1 Tax=Jeotgalibaca ciconiae TaxID=2496265 RepID=A0A3S9H7R8_9LACT|nr:hypothetical protein [Jeotgalibaca ciconiae]AZP03321.1 hypothetical protein EJN90_00800 [Jeotgalibaca ciconiae]
MEFLVTGKIQSLSKTFFEPLSLNHKTITAAEDIDSIIIGKHVKNYNCSPLDEDFLHLFHTHSFEGVVHFVDGLEAFPNAKIMMRQPFEAADIHGFGIYNDMTGHAEETIDWLDTIQNGGQYDQTSEEGGLISMENAWKTVPIGGEFTSSIPMHEMIVQNIDQTLKLLEASHTTYLGPRVP